MINFNGFITAVCTAIYVIASGVVSWTEGTLNSQGQRNIMGFLQHGGMWGDLILLSLVNALVVSRLPRLDRRFVLILAMAACLSVFITLVMHILWMTQIHQSHNLTHMFYQKDFGVWYKNISNAGWMHIVFMSAELTLLAVYTFFVMPVKTIYMVSLLLILHVVVGTALPGWYFNRIIWSQSHMIPSLGLIAVICFTAIFKLQARG